MKNYLIGVVVAVVTIGSSSAVQAANRDNVSVVGSSTVYPFATVVAERFGRSTDFKTPTIESTGTGGGLKLFCSGLGANTPDITNASRRIKMSEYENCQTHGVTDVVEVLVGYDGIAIANSTQSAELEISLYDIYLALAKDVPGADGKLIANPNITWEDVNPVLPPVKIEVLGPPPTSGTRDAFVELAMAGGAKGVPDLRELSAMTADQVDQIKAMMVKLGVPLGVYNALAERKGKAPKGKDIFTTLAYAIREDGAFIEAGENDNLIVQKLQANPDAVGIFGFSFLDENRDKVQGASVDGIVPTFDTIAGGEYPVSRPLYFYIKGAHVGKIPGIQEYAIEFTSLKAMGEDGYLTERGLIPLSGEELKQIQDDVKNLNRLELE